MLQNKYNLAALRAYVEQTRETIPKANQLDDPDFVFLAVDKPGLWDITPSTSVHPWVTQFIEDYPRPLRPVQYEIVGGDDLDQHDLLKKLFPDYSDKDITDLISGVAGS